MRHGQEAGLLLEVDEQREHCLIPLVKATNFLLDKSKVLLRITKFFFSY